MFEGSVSEQLHQFLTPRTPPAPPPNSNNSLPLIPLNFALHSPNNFNFHPFDSYNPTSTSTTHHHQIHLHHSSHQFLHQSSNGDEKDNNETATTTTTTTTTGNRSILMEEEDHHIIHHDEWRNDELLALLRIRSNIENCFHESTWEHVSRKLGEVGFRRTAEKCKEKFEEESRYFNNINYNKSCRFLTHELNYHHHQDHQEDHLLSLIHDENGKPDDDSGANVVVVPKEGKEENEDRDGELQEEREEEEQDLRNAETTNDEEGQRDEESSRSRSWTTKKKRKRKMMRQMEFELLKGYCEEIVKKMMSQQEEIHSKLLEEMLKKEEEKVAKEESWKKQQMEKLHKELEVMSHEQAIAGDRQTTIIEILKQITNSTTLISNYSSTTSKKDLQNLLKSLNNNNNIPTSTPSSSSLIIQTQTSNHNYKNSSSFTSPQNDSIDDPIIKNPKNPFSTTKILSPQDPNSLIFNQSNPKIRKKDEEDLGKRWPRDEVLALVNVRCKMYKNNNNIQEEISQNGVGGPSLKAPLWERISQGMLELGYKRSAKRCKEKWENINKYFRKTKDVNKKRSLDSRTCPYFHQLTTLYNQGGAKNNHPDDHSENQLATSSSS